MITAYRIPQDSITGCGPETSVMQQWRKLRAKGIEIPKPRQQTLDDIVNFATSYESKGTEVIIMMDANSPTTNPAMESFTNALNLHDLMADYLPDVPPKTYQCGRNKIDHIFGMIGVLTAMMGTSIIPFGEGPRSDHASIFATFSLSTLCGLPSQSLHDPTHPSARNLWSTDIKVAKAYMNLVHIGFDHDNISE